MTSPTALPPFGQVQLLQVNLNHCKSANETAKNHIIDNNIEIALLQDTYCNKSGELTGSPPPPSSARFPSKKYSAHLPQFQTQRFNYKDYFIPNKIIKMLTYLTSHVNILSICQC